MKLTPKMKSAIEEAINNNMDECGSCGSYHPIDFTGDCREDDFRYHPNDMENLLLAALDLLEACQNALVTLQVHDVDMHFAVGGNVQHQLHQALKKAVHDAPDS